MSLKLRQEAIDLIKSFEGFRSKPYRDQKGVCTIGYGTTHYPSGKGVRCSDAAVSEKEAEEIVRAEIMHHYYPRLLHMVNHKTTTQAQLDAMLSFVYNLGVNALRTSHLLMYHNRGEHVAAANEFQKWVHVAGKVNKGLIGRRQKEREIYLV